jgi:hypothetical protein
MTPNILENISTRLVDTSDQGRWQAAQMLRPPRSALLERAGEAGPEPTGRRYGVGHHR